LITFTGDGEFAYLRKKIDHSFHRRAIRTVRGAGYLLDPDGG
jgi:DNA-binding response OmpR family regulator